MGCNRDNFNFNYVSVYDISLTFILYQGYKFSMLMSTIYTKYMFYSAILHAFLFFHFCSAWKHVIIGNRNIWTVVGNVVNY
jgi:hypothetical protein